MWESIIGFLSRLTVLRIVRQYEGGVFLRCGKYKRTLGPGLYWTWPVVDDVQATTVVPRLVDLVDQSVTLEDGASVAFSGALEYEITDARKALLAVDNLAQSIQTLAMGFLADELSSRTFDESRDLRDVEESVVAAMKKQSRSWGVKIRRVWITDLSKHRVLRLLHNRAIREID